MAHCIRPPFAVYRLRPDPLTHLNIMTHVRFEYDDITLALPSDIKWCTRTVHRRRVMAPEIAPIASQQTATRAGFKTCK